MNYGNPYGPDKYTSKVGHTGDGSQPPSEAAQPQTQPVLPPPPNLPPKLAPAGFPGDEPHDHHDFPQQYRNWSKAPPRNIDIDQYMTEMPQQWHTGQEIGIHPMGYNEAWDAFNRMNPNASFSQTVNFMNSLKNTMGFGLGY